MPHSLSFTFDCDVSIPGPDGRPFALGTFEGRAIAEVEAHDQFEIHSVEVEGVHDKRPTAGDLRHVRTTHWFPLTSDFPFASQIMAAAESMAGRKIEEEIATGGIAFGRALAKFTAARARFEEAVL